MDMIHEARKTKCVVAHALFIAVATPKSVPNICDFENDITMSKLMHCDFSFTLKIPVSIGFNNRFASVFTFPDSCEPSVHAGHLAWCCLTWALVRHFPPKPGIHFEFEFSRVWQLARN